MRRCLTCSAKWLHENGTFYEFFPCLSRACLGKMMHFIYKWLKKTVFSPASEVASTQTSMLTPATAGNASASQLFPMYLVCPEPVLVKRSFLVYVEWLENRRVFRTAGEVDRDCGIRQVHLLLEGLPRLLLPRF